VKSLIDNNKKYSISEASKLIGFSNHVLRFYEKEFEIDVPRSKSNHRYYTYVEIEKFIYIKSLKEKGLSNQQIKQVINSPEEAMDEIAVTSSEQLVISKDFMPSNPNINMDFGKRLVEIKKVVQEELDDNFKILSRDLIEEVHGVLEYLKEGKNEDKDTLISENARLRMKLKEKAYEIAMLREKVKRMEQKKGSFFSRIFSINKKKI
jgi:DNA-binding transcriptional MerR regulator